MRDFVNRFHAWRSSFDAGNATAGLATGVLRIDFLLAAVVRKEVHPKVWCRDVVRVTGQIVFIWIVETVYYLGICIHTAEFAIKAVRDVAGELH